VVNAPGLDPNRWKALGVVGAAFLMTGLDISIVNVAIPTIGRELHFARENLQWVVTAYAIVFGGFLLLGGRAADLLGRRTVFLVGVVVFTGASLGCGLAGSEAVLIVMRGLQGLGGAIIAPAALSIVSTAFPEGAERNQALGVWGALGGSGAAIGVILGGILTKYAGWEWIFFVNVPIGAIVVALTPLFVRESKLAVARRRYDPLGAVAISGTMVLLVYSISKAPDVGWGSGRTIGLLAGAIVLLGAFLVIESRTAEPLMPLSIWRLRTVTAANVVGVVVGGIMFSTFFLLTLYAQTVLRYSSLQTGLAMLATALTAIAAAVAAEALVTRVGPKYVLAGGVGFMAAGLVYFAQIPVHGSYFANLFGPLVLIGLGTGFSFVPISIVALAGVPERETGLASGLMNTTQQVGGAVGTAIVSTIFATRVSHELPRLVAKGVDPQLAAARAAVSGFSLGYWTLAVVGFAGIGLALLILQGVTLGEPEEQPVETHVVSPFCFNRAATGAISLAVLGGDEQAEQPAVVT
jgi:EmrB/QacA subfamily drug resistance transporter